MQATTATLFVPSNSSHGEGFTAAATQLRAQIATLQAVMDRESCRWEDAALAYSREKLHAHFSRVKGRPYTDGAAVYEFFSTFFLLCGVGWISWRLLGFAFAGLLRYTALRAAHQRMREEEAIVRQEAARRGLGEALLRHTQRRLWFWCVLKVLLAAGVLIGMIGANSLVWEALRRLLRLWWGWDLDAAAKGGEGGGVWFLREALHAIRGGETTETRVVASDATSFPVANFLGSVQSLYLWYSVGPVALSGALFLLRSATEAQRKAREALIRQRQTYAAGSPLLHGLAREERRRETVEIASAAFLQVCELHHRAVAAAGRNGGVIEVKPAVEGTRVMPPASLME
ncbi:unnamed protein product [Phytomonas sp. EM1]|nr:unnamed protein product [Phytomonas sp. EM1]|eukprot:CCW60094.1 unnamed protein product [Phytomonas sp. isolate EM1]